MDGWFEDLGGNSQGPGPMPPFSGRPYQQRFWNSGLGLLCGRARDPSACGGPF